MDRARPRVRRARGPLRLRADRDPGVRARRGVRPVGRVDRRRAARRCTSSPTVGDRRLALRPEGTAPVVRAYVQHKKHGPVEGLVPRPALPVRAPPEGPLPPALAARDRGPGPGRPRRRRRGDRVRARAPPGPGCARRHARSSSTRWAIARAEPSTSASFATTCSRTATSWVREFRERVEANPLRVLDSKRDDWQDVIERAPQLTEHLSDTSREHFEQVQRGLDELGIQYELDAPPRARLRLLHEHDVRVRERRARRRAERGPRRRALRQPRRGDGRAAHAGDRVRHGDRAPADRRRTRWARCRRPRRGSTCSSSTASRAVAKH